MKQVIEFFSKMFDVTDWPARWYCGTWSSFHGWLYIVSDLLIWSAYFAIPLVILKFIKKKHGVKFLRLYVLFAAFILACGATHFLDAVAFWLPAYRLTALLKFITGVISWVTVFYVVRNLPTLVSLRTQDQLEAEIEQRKKAEEEVRQLNRLLDSKVIARTAELNDYKYALDESSIVNFTDENGKFTQVNENFCRISKYSREELIGNDFRMMEAGRYQRLFVDDLWSTISEGRIWKGELMNKAKDGSFFWCDTTIVPFLNKAGEPYQYIAIRVDITDRKKAESLKRDLEQQMKLKTAELAGIFERITDGFIILDKNFHYTYANERVGKMIGREPANLVGKNVWEEFPEAVGSATYEALHRARESGEYVYNVDYYQPLDLWQENHIYPTAEGLSVFIRDITYQKRAEASLRESEARFRRIFESNMVGLMFWDASGNVLEANDRFLSIVGYTRSDLTANRIQWNSMTPPEYAYKDEAGLQEIQRTGICQPFEKEYCCKDGSRVHVLVGGASVESNSVEKGIAFVLDISESKRAAAQILKLNQDLITSERTFRSLVENNNDVLSLTDEHFKAIYRSPNVQRITGWTEEEISGMDNLDLVHPDDRAVVAAYLSEIQLTPSKSIPFNYRYRHKKGHYIYLEGTAINKLDDPSIKGIVTNFRDVTEQKLTEAQIIRSEKTYKTIASSIPGTVICILDRDLRYLLIEGDMLETIGFSKDALLGKRAAEVFPQERLKIAEADFHRVFADETFKTDTTRENLYTISRFIPLKDEHNYVYAAMVVVSDVTDLKQAELRIAELNVDLENKVRERTEELHAVNKELEAFSYSVSHDLRAPLRAINGYANILLEDYGTAMDAEANRVLQAIVKNSTGMGQLIDDLLRFSRIGRKEMAIAVVDMNAMVNFCLEEMLPHTNLSRYTIAISQLPDVTGDAALIKQVWVNLLSNAVKYSSRREQPRIDIGCKQDRGRNVFYIQDNGVGFDMKYADKLFGVFQRLHVSTEFEGTGVGLALVNRILKKHNGSIWAEAEAGKGSTFYFTFSDLIT